MIAGEQRHPFQKILPETPNLSFANEGIRSPNTTSLVMCYRGKVKFSSRLSGSPTGSA